MYFKRRKDMEYKLDFYLSSEEGSSDEDEAGEDEDYGDGERIERGK